MRKIVISIIVNVLFSWTILPVLIPPFRGYTFSELLEVLFWQGSGTVGWPIVLIGGFVNMLLQRTLDDLGTLIIVFVYPGMLFLLIRVVIVRPHKWWELFLLHFLLTFSFAAVWYQVLNGYDFMVG